MSVEHGYARGDKAWAHCERCGDKTLLKYLQYDGQYPDLQVCSKCWDPKHPQEFLPPTWDPITLYDPTGDLDLETSGDAVSGQDAAPPCDDQPEADTGCDINDLGYQPDATVVSDVTDSYTIEITPAAGTLDYDLCYYVETGLETGIFTQHGIDFVNQQGEFGVTTLTFLQKVTTVAGARVYFGPQGQTGECNIPPSRTIVLVGGDSAIVSFSPDPSPSGTDRT